MHRRNSLHRVRMRKKRRVLRGISLGAKFMVVLIGLVVGGLIYLAFPILIVVGIVGLLL